MYVIVAVYFTRVLSCLETLIGNVIFLKGLIAAEFESSELLYMVRLNGCVGTIDPYIESTNFSDRMKMLYDLLHSVKFLALRGIRRGLLYSPHTNSFPVRIF